MDWNAVGAVGEVGGAIGVIVTLIYLAGQLRQNTKALRSSTYATYNASALSWADSTMQYAKELAEIKVDNLSPAEAILLDGIAFKAWTVMQSNFLHHRAGAMDSDVFEALTEASVNTVANNELLRIKWADAQQFYGVTPDFKAFLEAKLQSRSLPGNQDSLWHGLS